MIKPDGVARGLVGTILERFENKGLNLAAMKLAIVTKDQAEQLYAEHKAKPFYQGLEDFALSGPSVQMVLEGKEAFSVVRTVIGATNPRQAAPGSVRGDLGIGLPQNLIHASDSEQSAQREISIFFTETEILEYKRADEPYLGKE
ncbi:MAG: nucleoside-diphosphate kinase [Candidatus Aenigmarchaeota archaeon]|nr:nucleoside-diphosphate kinase [Candidatus Aenigmarchaeota archaeon]